MNMYQPSPLSISLLRRAKPTRELEKQAPVDQQSHPALILLAARPELFAQHGGFHDNALFPTDHAKFPRIFTGTRFFTPRKGMEERKEQFKQPQIAVSPQAFPRAIRCRARSWQAVAYRASRR
jgi:hypothetical protein